MAQFLKFTVEGCGTFPVDMLRYDGCYPRDTESAVALTYCHRCTKELTSQPRQVNLTSRIERGFDPGPTDARWNSFGWKVVKKSTF